MPVYEITSSRGGVSDYENRGIAGAFKFGSGLDIRKFIDSISCQQGVIDESDGVFVDLIYFYVVASDGNTYGFGNTGRIYKRDTNFNWSVVYVDPDGAITGAAEWPSDDGKTWLIWATRDKLKCKELPGTSDWSDVNNRTANDGATPFPMTDLTGTDWHTMKESNGDLLIANRERVALLGYDSSYSPEVLDIIPGNVVKTIVERNSHAIIGTERRAQPNKGINAAIDAEVPLAQVGDDGQIFYADMQSMIPAKRFSGGGRSNPGAVDLDIDQVTFFEWVQAASANPNVNSWLDKKSIGGMALFGVFGAEAGKNGIWTYGRKQKNQPFVMNLDYPFECDEIGAVKNVGGEILFSYRIGNGFGTKRIDLTRKGIGIYEGLDYKAPTKKVSQITKWKFAEFFIKDLPAGCSIQFFFRMNKTGEFKQAEMGTEEDGSTFTIPNLQKVVFLIGDEGEIFEPRLLLMPNGNDTPEVFRQRYYFN